MKSTKRETRTAMSLIVKKMEIVTMDSRTTAMKLNSHLLATWKKKKLSKININFVGRGDENTGGIQRDMSEAGFAQKDNNLKLRKHSISSSNIAVIQSGPRNNYVGSQNSLSSTNN